MNTLPTNWCIEVTEENQEELDRWRQQVATENLSNTLAVGYTLLSSHHHDGSHYYCANARKVKGLDSYADYQEITLVQFRQITNPKPMNTLPTNWYIEVTEENQEELNRWRKKVATQYRDHTVRVGHTLLSRHQDDGSYYYSGNPKNVRASGDYDDYQEITLEQFLQITNQTPNQKPMTKSIQISRELLNQYYDAATIPQREYLTVHFKLDGTTTDEAIRGLHDFACSKWKPRIKKNHPDCFPEDSKHFDFSGHVEKNGYVSVIPEDAAESLGLNHDFIRVRHNPKNEKTHRRSFYLDSDYNWELVQDGAEEGGDVIMALIPTKKQS
jgi:hypothetical protein